MIYFEKFPSCYFFTLKLLFSPVLKSNEAKIEFLKYPQHVNVMKNRILYIQWSIIEFSEKMAENQWICWKADENSSGSPLSF